jgi:hypothetical protein
MSPETLLFFRFVSSFLFAATVVAGAYFVKRAGKLFGKSPALPSENASARTYAQLEAFVVLVHALLLTGGLTILFFV